MAGSGVWYEQEVAGHACDVFEPAVTHVPARALCIVYLHDADMQRLADQPAFAAELERRGLRSDRTADRTKLVDGQDLCQVRSAAFGRAVRARPRYARTLPSGGAFGRRRSACWGRAWAGRVRCDWH